MWGGDGRYTAARTREGGLRGGRAERGREGREGGREERGREPSKLLSILIHMHTLTEDLSEWPACSRIAMGTLALKSYSCLQSHPQAMLCDPRGEGSCTSRFDPVMCS